MTRITDLTERMALIPGKVSRAVEINGMTTVRDKLLEAADQTEELRNLAEAFSKLESLEISNRIAEGLAQASKAAQRWKSHVEGGKAFDRKDADSRLIAINERLDQASNAATKGWRATIDDQTKKYQPLAEAAERAGLPGASALDAAIEKIATWREAPPATIDDATEYLAQAGRVPAAIATLGLEGKAGRFMVEASDGRAKAKDLQDPEVLAFLTEYPSVWAMLKVRL